MTPAAQASPSPTTVLDVLVVGAGHAGREVLRVLAAAGLAVQAVDWGPAQADGVWGRTTAIGLEPGPQALTVYLASASGPPLVQARRVVAATGAVEAPREALQIPGDRPAGVMTPALAQSLLERGLLPGHR